MLGFIHPSERYTEPRLGQVLRCAGDWLFREVDRTLNLSLKPRSLRCWKMMHKMILDISQKANGGFMT